MEISVNRIWSAPDNAQHRATTTGQISVDGTPLCFCLERTATLIPTGVFPVALAMSKRFQRRTPHISVPGRTEIEMHGANTADDVDGCVGCAEKRLDDYTIYESEPATTALENMLLQAEANGEVNTVTVT
jgi:hypothetical protein